MACLALITRTDGIEKPNDLEPDPKAFILSESIETETECFLKFRTGTEEFWNRTSTSYPPRTPFGGDINDYPIHLASLSTKTDFMKFLVNILNSQLF